MLVLHDTAVAADGGKYYNKTTEGRASSGIQGVEGIDCVGGFD